MLSLFFAELLLKGAVVTAVAFAVFRLAVRASPAYRHAVLASTMCVLVTLPIAVVAVPTWTVPWLPELTAQLSDLTPSINPASVNGESIRAASAPSEVRPPMNPRGIGTLPEAARGMRPATGEGAGQFLRRASIVAAFGWILGALFLLGRTARGVVRAHTISRVGSTLAEGRERELTAQCAADAGLSREPAVRVSHWTTVPLTWGLFRPLLLLPPSVEFWTDERAEAAIRHEVAHIRRRDYLWHLIGEIATALHWPNPLVWWSRRALRLEQEQACDDSVLRTGANSSDYASHLVEIARSTGPGSWKSKAAAGSVGLAAGDLAPSGPRAAELGSGTLAVSDLGVRVDGILNGKANRAPLSPARLVGGALLAAGLGLAVGGAAVRPAPSTPASAADVWALASHTSPDAATLLFEELRYAPADRRGVAALSLGKRGDRRAIPDLVAALDDPDPYVREYAIVALVEFGGAVARDAVLEVAADSVTSVRSVTSWALGELGGERSAEALLNMIDSDPDMHTRSMAVMALARIEDADIKAMLTQRLEHASNEARLDIVAALGHSGDPATVPVLDQLARTHEDVSVRIMASRALNEIDDPRRIDTWLAGMADSEWRVRNLSLLQLAQTEDPRARGAIVEALRDPKHQVRLNAAWALGESRP